MTMKKGSEEPCANMKALRSNPQRYEWRPSRIPRSLANFEEADGRCYEVMFQEITELGTFPSPATTEL
jgi:hypothetical protein